MQYTTKYDSFFERYTLEFFGKEVDWLLFKAQGIAESGLDQLALSNVGAKGVMQLMPGTSAEIAKDLSCSDLPYVADINIRMGVFYDRWCYRIWESEKGIERFRFMFASYNAGVGNIVDAQRLSRVKDKWDEIAKQLSKITGKKNAKQTIDYIKRIEETYALLKGSDLTSNRVNEWAVPDQARK